MQGDYVNRNGHERVKELDYVTRALAIFTKQNDTSGMVYCYDFLTFLNVYGPNRVQGSLEIANQYLQKVLALAAKSAWPGDKLIAAANLANANNSFFRQHPDSLIHLTQQSISIIKANPQFNYLMPKQLTNLSFAYEYKNDYQRALHFSFACLRITPEQHLRSRATYNANIGEDYYELQKFDSAEIYLKEAEAISDEQKKKVAYKNAVQILKLDDIAG